MQQIRIRTAPSPDDRGYEDLYIEVWREQWVKCYGEVTPDKVRQFVSRMHELDSIGSITPVYVEYLTHAFDTGIIQNWREEKPVTID